MSVDYGSSNTTRYYSLSDDADFALPDSDWAWMVQCRIEPDAVNPRYIIATNGYGNAASLNLVVNSTPFRLLAKYNATADLFTASSPPESVPVWLYATRRSGVFYAGFCPVGSSTVVEATGTNISGTTSDGAVMRLGGNSTGASNRTWLGGWTQYALSSGQGVTAAQIAELAMGEPLFAMPFAPSLVFALHGKAAAATIADLIKGKVATRQGTSYGTNEEDVQTPYAWAPLSAQGSASPGTNYTLTASPGSFAITGTAASLKYGRSLSASSGLFAVTGTAATLKKGYKLQAATGSFLITGAAATLKSGRIISAADGSFQTSGASASLKYGRALSAQAGAFQIAGTDATLVYGTAGNYTLIASPGSFSVTGTAAALKLGRRLQANSGSFAFAGTAATLRYARQVIAEAGSFAITGTSAILSKSAGAVSASRTFTIQSENRTYAVTL